MDSELDESVIADEQLARILASGKQSITSPEMANSTPLLPGEELAPIPSNNEVFGKFSAYRRYWRKKKTSFIISIGNFLVTGKIMQLRNKHIREMQEYEQNQRMNRVRVTQDLKEKLNERRSRRSRMEMHKRQLEALQESPL